MGAVAGASRGRGRAVSRPGVLVIGVHQKQAKWLKDVLEAREHGKPLATWMREKGRTHTQVKAAQRLQRRMRKRGEVMEAEDTRGLLLSLRAEVVDRVKRRAGAGTEKLVSDVGVLREIDAALRQHEVWEREDRERGRGTAPAAPGAAVSGARGARNGATGARGGGKAGAEGVLGALSAGETGGSEGECAVEAAGEALGGGIGGGEGDGGGVLLSVPLAGC